jgi:hypothetical protein
MYNTSQYVSIVNAKVFENFRLQITQLFLMNDFVKYISCFVLYLFHNSFYLCIYLFSWVMIIVPCQSFAEIHVCEFCFS